MMQYLLTILLGVIVVPTALFGLAVLLQEYRARKGMAHLPPRVVSAMLILCVILSFCVTIFNVVRLLIGQ
jgi:hypothetical protein